MKRRRIRRRHPKSVARKTLSVPKKTVRIAPILAFLLVGIALFISYRRSVLFGTSKTRVQFVVYGQKTQFFSLGLSDGIHYAAAFAPDTRIQVPGGYGEYRIGGLGKLVSLEKKPVIFQKAFSYLTGSFVTLYFYPDTDTIYYGDTLPENPQELRPTVSDLLTLKTNGSFFDKIFIAYLFAKNGDPFKQLEKNPATFKETYHGYFYYAPFRTDNKSVRIDYTKASKVAEGIGEILEGVGIKVSDINRRDITPDTPCIIYESALPLSTTGSAIADFFGCRAETGDTDIYDSVFSLGNLEKEWEL